jgi:DNA-directed RNA polymerase subunit beta'
MRNIYEVEAAKGWYFYSFEEAADAYQQRLFSIHKPLWVRFDGPVETDTPQEEPLEVRLDFYGRFQWVSPNLQEIRDLQGDASSQFVRTTAGRILVNLSLPFALRS